MLALPRLVPDFPPLVASILDALLLTGLAVPVLYLLLFARWSGRSKSEDGLRRRPGGTTRELAERASESRRCWTPRRLPSGSRTTPRCRLITGNSYADQIVMQIPRGGNISRSALPGDEAVSYRVLRGDLEARAGGASRPGGRCHGQAG